MKTGTEIGCAKRRTLVESIFKISISKRTKKVPSSLQELILFCSFQKKEENSFTLEMFLNPSDIEATYDMID